MKSDLVRRRDAWAEVRSKERVDRAILRILPVVVA